MSGGVLVGAPACDKGVLDLPDNYEMYEFPLYGLYTSRVRRSTKELSGLFATRDVLQWSCGGCGGGRAAIMASIY